MGVPDKLYADVRRDLFSQPQRRLRLAVSKQRIRRRRVAHQKPALARARAPVSQRLHLNMIAAVRSLLLFSDQAVEFAKPPLSSGQ